MDDFSFILSLFKAGCDMIFLFVRTHFTATLRGDIIMTDSIKLSDKFFVFSTYFVSNTLLNIYIEEKLVQSNSSKWL